MKPECYLFLHVILSSTIIYKYKIVLFYRADLLHQMLAIVCLSYPIGFAYRRLNLALKYQRGDVFQLDKQSFILLADTLSIL